MRNLRLRKANQPPKITLLVNREETGFKAKIFLTFRGLVG